MSAISNSPIRVLLLASYPVVRAGLRRLLEEHEGLQVIGESAETADAVARVEREEVDVVLVDPDAEEVGLAAVTTLVNACPCRILIFSAATDSRVSARAIELGAAGVVSKVSPGHLLVRAIGKVHAGELWLDRAQTASVLSRAVGRRQDPERAKIESLTNREREIVTLLGEGLGNVAVASRLFISEATVRNHLTSILGKLSVSNRFELAVYAFRHNLLGSPDAIGPLRQHLVVGEPRRPEAADAGGPRHRVARGRPVRSSGGAPE